MIPSDYRVEASRDCAQDRFGARRAHLANDFHLAAELFLPHGAVGVEQDFDRLRVLQSGQEGGAEVPPEFFQAAPERLIFAVALFDSVL